MNAETLTMLLPALRAGDEDAWSRVFLEMHDALVRHAMKLGLNQHDAEDCVMEAWNSAIPAIKKGGARKVLHPAYFYLVVRREALRFLKKRRGDVALDGLEDHVRDAILSQLETNGVSAATANDLDVSFEEVLRSLDARELELFRLRYVEKLTWEETGRRLGLSLSGAVSLDRRMLDRLRRWFGSFDL